MPIETANNTGSAENNPEEVLPKVEVNIKEKPKDVAPLLDFSSPEDLEKMLAAPTETGQLNDKNNNGGGGNNNNQTTNPFGDDTKKTIVTELGQTPPNDNLYTDKVDISEYAMWADIIVYIIDRFVIGGLRIFAKDSTDKPYEPTTKNTDMIKKHLTSILMRTQKKWPIEFLLFMAILGAYFTPAWKAWEHRQAVLKLEKEKKALEDAKAEAEKKANKKTTTSVSEMVRQPVKQQQVRQQPVVRQQVVHETTETVVEKQQETPVQPKKTVRIDPSAMIKRNSENAQNSPPAPRKIIVPKRTVPVPTVPKRKQGGINK